jgi:hypothetical protein
VRLQTDRMFYERNILEVLRMFYERNILEDPTKWNFHDSPRIEQSLLEKTSTSLVYSISYEYVDTVLKRVTSTPVLDLTVLAHPKASFRL